MDSQYTVNQHYIPQFILRNFADRSNRVGIADITKKPMAFFTNTPKSICHDKNLYESQNLDGTYFERNKVENCTIVGKIRNCSDSFSSIQAR